MTARFFYEDGETYIGLPAEEMTQLMEGFKTMSQYIKAVEAQMEELPGRLEAAAKGEEFDPLAFLNEQ